MFPLKSNLSLPPLLLMFSLGSQFKSILRDSKDLTNHPIIDVFNSILRGLAGVRVRS